MQWLDELEVELAEGMTFVDAMLKSNKSVTFEGAKEYKTGVLTVLKGSNEFITTEIVMSRVRSIISETARGAATATFADRVSKTLLKLVARDVIVHKDFKEWKCNA